MAEESVRAGNTISFSKKGPSRGLAAIGCSRAILFFLEPDCYLTDSLAVDGGLITKM